MACLPIHELEHPLKKFWMKIVVGGILGLATPTSLLVASEVRMSV